jgi:hypothetical protein
MGFKSLEQNYNIYLIYASKHLKVEKVKQMKEITEKSNKLKEFEILESLKEAKKIQKEQLSKKKNGLSFISNRQRRKEGTLRASGVGRDRTHAGPPQWSRVCPP